MSLIILWLDIWLRRARGWLRRARGWLRRARGWLRRARGSNLLSTRESLVHPRRVFIFQGVNLAYKPWSKKALKERTEPSLRAQISSI